MRHHLETVWIQDRKAVVDVGTECVVNILGEEPGGALPVNGPVGEVADHLLASVRDCDVLGNMDGLDDLVDTFPGTLFLLTGVIFFFTEVTFRDSRPVTMVLNIIVVIILQT